MSVVPIKRLRLICSCCEQRVDRTELGLRSGGQYDGHRVCTLCQAKLDEQERPTPQAA